MRRYILNSANFTYESFADNRGKSDWSNNRLGEVERIYHDGLLPLLDINEYELFDVMTRIFPGDIISYYCDCIIHMKDKIREKVTGR